MKAFKSIVESNSELLPLYEDARAIGERRNLLAHSVAMVVSDARQNGVYLYWHLKSGEEATFYPHELMELDEEIEAMCRQLYTAIQKRTEDTWWSANNGKA